MTMNQEVLAMCDGGDLPLLPKLPDHLLGREVAVNLGGGQAVVAPQRLAACP
jgi:hypothetical protein